MPQGDIFEDKAVVGCRNYFSLSAFAQSNSQTSMAVEPMAHTPTFRVTVISRTVQAVNYHHHSGSTKLDFAGTDLMPVCVTVKPK